MNNRVCIVLVLAFCSIVAARVDLDDDWRWVSDELLLDEQNIERASSVEGAIEPGEKERLLAVVRSGNQVSSEDTLTIASLFRNYYDNKKNTTDRSNPHIWTDIVQKLQGKKLMLSQLAYDLEAPMDRCLNNGFMTYKSTFTKEIPTSTRAVLPLVKEIYKRQVNVCKMYAITVMTDLLEELGSAEKQILIDFGNHLNIDGSAQKGGLVSPLPADDYAKAALAYLKQHNLLDADLSLEQLTNLLRVKLIDFCENKSDLLTRMSMKVYTLPEDDDDENLDNELEQEVKENFWAWTERAEECLMMASHDDQVYNAAYKIYTNE